MACYLWYQYLQLAGRFVYLLVVLAYYLNDNSSYYEYNNDNNNTITQDNNVTTTRFTGVKLFPVISPVFDCILITCMFIMQIFITYYINRFFRLLPSNSDYNKIRVE